MAGKHTKRSIKALIILQFGTQRDFAQAVDMSPSSVSQAINGRRKLWAYQALKWYGALKCEPHTLDPFV